MTGKRVKPRFSTEWRGLRYCFHENGTMIPEEPKGRPHRGGLCNLRSENWLGA